MNIPAPLLIMVWVGFAICVGLVLLSQFAQSGFQKRMAQTVRSVDDDAREILEERQEDEMGKSLVQRLLQPILVKMGSGMKNAARGAKGGQLREMLSQAGNPLGMGVAEFTGLKFLMLIVMTTIGFFSSFYAVPLIISFMGSASDATTSLMFMLLWVLIFAFIGFSGPTFWLRRFINKRIKQIRKSMADVVDLIVLGIEAGLGFDAAVGKTVEKTKGPLTDELRRVLAEVNVGRSQSEAWRDMALRVRMGDLTLLVAAIDQAVKMGVGLAHALRLQAQEIREKRMAYIREQAGKLPVKMMLPLVLCIFPALFIVILGPAACQVAEMAARGELSAFGA